MNVNDVRIRLGDAIKAAAGQMWTITTVTTPDLAATYTAQIGHAAPSPETYRSRRVALPVTLWVNENNAQASQGVVYAAVSWEPDSVVSKLSALDWVGGVTVDSVGPRREGPTGFLAADLTVTVHIKDGGSW